MSAASISSSTSPLDFLRLKAQKPKAGTEQPDAADALQGPNAELLRMIQGIMKPQKSDKAAEANSAQDIYAEIKVGGKTVATIYNDGSTETSNALAARAKLSDGARDDGGPDIAEKRSQELAAAAGGKIVTASSAISQAEWSASQADKPGAVEDPVAREKQRWYSGLNERRMIADPSMLLQAQLFAQQTENAQASVSAAPRTAAYSDHMASGETTT